MYKITEDDNGKEILVEEPSPEFECSYTYADYIKWKIEDRLELFKGKIFKLAAPNTTHQVISGNLYLYLRTFLFKEACKVFIAPFDVRLPVKNRKKDNEISTVVQPDLCVVCDPSKIDERGCCGAPDIMVEVLSPGNTRKEVKLKFELYEEAGIKEYWLVNPVEQNMIVYCLDDNNKFGGGKIYADGDMLESVILPGFQLNVSDVFTK